MISGLKKAWNHLRNLNSIKNVVDGVTSEIFKLDNDKMTKTTEKLGRNKTIRDLINQLNYFPIVKADENVDKVQWQDMMIKGPSPYSSMRKTFSDVLIDWSENSQKLNGSFCNVDCKVTIGIDCLDINGKHKYVTYSPFFEFGRKNIVGLKIEPHEWMSLGVAIDLKSDTFRSFVTLQNSTAVLETKVNIRAAHQDSTPVKMGVSGVFGHTFKKFGILAGFDLTLFRRKEVCQAISLGLVSPATTGVLTIQPNDKLIILKNGWKINGSLKLVTRSKTNYTSPTWNSRDHEVGLRYKHSQNIVYGVQADLAGTVIVRTWFNWSYLKLALLAKTSITQNIVVIEDYGISIEI